MGDIDYWERANVLRGEAEYQDFKHGIGTYEWEIGMDAYNSFISDIVIQAKDCCKEFMGIPIRINIVNRQCLKLWREVDI